MIRVLLVVLLGISLVGFSQVKEGVLIPFRNGNEWYYVNEFGEKNSKHVYESATPFGLSNYAAIKLDGKYGFVDKIEKIIITPVYDFATPIYGVLTVSIESDTFRIDQFGNRGANLIGCGNNGGGLTTSLNRVFTINGKMGVYFERDTIIQPIYDSIEIIRYTEVIMVKNAKGKFAVFDENGNMSYPFELDSFEKCFLYNSVYSPLAAIIVVEKGKKGAFDINGNLIAKPKYNNLQFDYWAIPFTVLKNGEIGYVYKGNEYWKE